MTIEYAINCWAWAAGDYRARPLLPKTTPEGGNLQAVAVLYVAVTLSGQTAEYVAGNFDALRGSDNMRRMYAASMW